MLTINQTQEDLIKKMNSFIWEFKIGDNIEYNLDIIFNLIKNDNNIFNYKKPISILCISVIEAIFVDLLHRLDMGTNHFPKKLTKNKSEIKKELDKEKRVYQISFLDETYQGKKLRNFGYKDLINFLKKFSILGSTDEVYTILQKMGHFRNRVHIKNYFNNFEKDESVVFSEKRTQKIINCMVWIFNYFEENYSRP
jgi:hypothetical protein